MIGLPSCAYNKSFWLSSSSSFFFFNQWLIFLILYIDIIPMDRITDDYYYFHYYYYYCVYYINKIMWNYVTWMGYQMMVYSNNIRCIMYCMWMVVLYKYARLFCVHSTLYTNTFNIYVYVTLLSQFKYGKYFYFLFDFNRIYWIMNYYYFF